MSLNRRNIPESIADFLTEEIVSGRLQPKTPLREKDWAAQLEVARGSVREAFLILERLHLVELRPGKGARVSALQGRWLAEVFELWYLLFEHAVVKAAIHPLDDKTRLLAEQRKLQRLATDPSTDNFFDQAINLVVLIAQCADHHLLQRQIMDLLPAARRVYRWILRNDEAEVQRSLQLAELVLQAIGKRDGDTAARAVRNYAKLQRRALDRAITNPNPSVMA